MNTAANWLLLIIPAVFAVTIHEIAHGLAADRLGDSTARLAGRLSLNPLRHVDPIGTVLVPLGLYLASGMFFGWARPVPVAWGNLRHPRRDIALVAVAGPASNLAMLVGWFVLLQVAVATGLGTLIYMSRVGIMFNATIMLLNLIPIPPLDGSRIVTAALPARAAMSYNRLETYGLPLLALLLFSGVLSTVLGPAIGFFHWLATSRLL